MKVSRRTREQAALICAIAASSTHPHPYYDFISDGLGIDRFGKENELAHRAWARVVGRREWTREVDAEAEALLRTGWTP